MERLQKKLVEIDRCGYKAYKQIQGSYSFPGFTLCIDHVQGDPFAEPSRCRILVNRSSAAIPSGLHSNSIRTIALEDYLGRSFTHALMQFVKGKRGSGRSGEITMTTYGQQVLQRNAVLVRNGAIDLRFQVGLPAEDRSISSDQAKQMLLHELPQVVTSSLLSINNNISHATTHVDSVEDQQHLRSQLQQKGLVAFVGDDSTLPRLSGIDDSPLADVVPFCSPDSMAVELKRLHADPIRGLAIPQGVTLIIGGGFHGKSTLLHALEYGVYNHIKGDGRELVVTEQSACKIRSEDGRAVTGVDISPFINNLPQGKDTKQFFTQNASGSTSQATNVMEAIATNAKTLLIDEDTSAANFMLRDTLMQKLVTKDKEPITPLTQHVRNLYNANGISTVLAIGGSGDFFAHADHVLMLDNYLVKDQTAQAHALTGRSDKHAEKTATIIKSSRRIPNRNSLSPLNSRGKIKIQAFETRTLRYGSEEIDLSRVEQLVDRGQLLAIGYMMAHYQQLPHIEQSDMLQLLEKVTSQIGADGLDSITPYTMGTLAMPRLHELAATISRIRGLKLRLP